MITNEFEAVLGDYKMALKTAIGQFYPDLEYGTLFSEKKKEKDFLLCCANQAANYIDGLFVKKILCRDNGLQVDLYINETEGQVFIDIESYT